MAETKWTNDQQNAIDARGGTLLLSAAAGSGKTAVLVERIIKMLTDGKDTVEPGELLVVTFTNAAAAEMRARISAAVDKLIEKEPTNSFYRSIKMKLPEAKITTMDSFCIGLVRENFHSSDVEPDFTLLETGEERILIAEAMARTLDSMCKDSPELYNLLNTMTAYGRDDSALASKIEDLYNFSLSHPFSERWLREIEEMYSADSDIKTSLWGRLILEEAFVNLDYCRRLIISAMADSASDEVVHGKYCEPISAVLDIITDAEKVLRDGSWDEICQKVNSGGIIPGSLPVARGFATHPAKVSAELKYKEAKTVLSKLKTIFCATEQEHREDMAKLRPVIDGLMQAVRDFSSVYASLKRERNSYTFTDIMHFALKLLVREENGEISKTSLAYDLQGRYHEILIDEYQDTNEAQDMLFTVLSKNGSNMFMVGDVKQSIYRFRLAMPEIFMKKSREFCDYDGVNFPAKIFLGQNFRSRKGVLENINFLFKNLMSDYAGEMEYTDRDALYYSDVYDEENPEPDVSLRFLTGSGNEDEAEYVAELIEKTVESGATVSAKDGKRNARYGDFCILLRSLKGKAELYENALRRRNIKVIYEKKTNLFDTTEAGVFMSLLKVINNPTDDVALLSVMFSPLYGFTADETAEIRLHDKKTNLYTCLKISSETNKKAEKLLSDLAYYRQLSAVMPFDIFMRTLLETTGYMAVVSALPGGEDRKMNLMLLCSLGSDYADRGSKGIGGFIRYINRSAENGADISAATSGTSDTNAVRIMSIHKSKGLEFPFVILADCGKKINKTDSAEDMIVSPSAGVGMVILNSEKLQKYSSLGHMAAKLAVKRATISEELRILYVAMTRAREKLIAVSTVKKLENEIKGALVSAADGKPSPCAVINASTYVRWLLMGYMNHPDMNRILQDSGFLVNFDFAGADSRLEVVAEGDREAVVFETENSTEAQADDKIIEEIRTRAEFVYPYKIPADARPKRVASDFEKKIFNEQYFAKSKPSFLNQGQLTAAEAGIANHLFMQNLDFDSSDINAECERMVISGILSEEQAKAIRRDKVQIFTQSELFSRIRTAEKVYREKEFTVQIRLGDIDTTADESVADEKILILGKADLVFVENGEIVIVDYKTDRTKSEQDFVTAYSGQLRMYSRAMAQILELPVKESLIYSLELGKEIKI
ncbi:MAG: helicase-exonuclease AddAB subunit AddA [Clostridia bacterium]|nr:helicase-exonuclease AddAB subunit AddA [Clostridia bacterium]